MPRHIEKRHRTWHAVLMVPQDVQRKLRRKKFRVSLQTHDEKAAERRAAPLVAEWQSIIARARGDEAAQDDPAFWRKMLAGAKTPEERQIVEHELETHVLGQGYDNSDAEAKRFYARAFGSVVGTTEHLDEWIASLDVKAKTAGMRRSTIQRLAKKFPTLQDINRREVRLWVNELKEPADPTKVRPVAPATVRRMLTDCRLYWKYLADIVMAVPEDSAPFDQLGLKVPDNHRQPWTAAELVSLHKAADGPLADLVLLGMYTGARLGELCSLRVADVAKDHFIVREAKTEAGRRQVPIHSKLRSAVARMTKGKAPSDYVLTGIDGKHRADTMSKAFRRLRERLGHTERQEKTLHSIRNTVITALEHAGVPEGTVQDIVGHQRSTVTGSTYSGKSTLAMRAKALAKLRYPA
ncbi:MAG: tyrosine-type recombinase/integrase [Kiloniellaceae bacterium]